MPNNTFFDDSAMQMVPKKIFEHEELTVCDVFLRMGKGHYLKIAKEAQKSSLSAYSFYQKIDSFLYIEKSHFSALIENKFNKLHEIFDLSNSFEESANQLICLYESIFWELTETEPGLESMQRIDALRPFVIRLAQASPNLLILLKMMKKESALLSTHSFLVSIVALQVALEADSSVDDLYKIFLGAYFHDVGFLFLPKEINRNIKSLLPRELLQFESHPSVGAAFVAKIKKIPDEIAKIVEEHHENNFGTGYPKGLTREQIYKFSRMVALAECYVELVCGSPATGDALNPHQAINYISNVFAQPFEESYFKILQDIVNRSH